METDRCGHVQEVITREDVEAVCCWRPVWEGRDRCVWHADDEGKPREAFEHHHLCRASASTARSSRKRS